MKAAARWLVMLALAGTAMRCVATDIVVLQVAPWTGSKGEAGWNAHVGAQLAFDEFNAVGGLQGRRVKLVLEVEQPDTLDQQVRGLVQQWDPVALVGMVGASPLKALLNSQAIASLQLPTVGVTSGAPSLRKLASPLVVQTRVNQEEELNAIFQHLATVTANKATLVVADDKEPAELQRLASEIGNKLHVEIVDTIVVPPTEGAMEPAVMRVQATPHNAVILAADTPATAQFCRLYKQAGGKGQIVSLSTAEPARLASFGGKAAARGVMFALAIPNPRQRNVPVVHEYLDAFKRFGPAGVSPTVSIFESYIAARVLIEGLKQTAPATSRTALARYFGSTTTVWISGYPVQLNAGPGSKRASLTMLDIEGRMLW